MFWKINTSCYNLTLRAFIGWKWRIMSSSGTCWKKSHSRNVTKQSFKYSSPILCPSCMLRNIIAINYRLQFLFSSTPHWFQIHKFLLLSRIYNLNHKIMCATNQSIAQFLIFPNQLEDKIEIQTTKTLIYWSSFPWLSASASILLLPQHSPAALAAPDVAPAAAREAPATRVPWPG